MKDQWTHESQVQVSVYESKVSPLELDRIELVYILHLLTFMHLADAFFFYPKRFRLYTFCQYVCSLGIKPTTFTLLMQCSTTEPLVCLVT